MHWPVTFVRPVRGWIIYNAVHQCRGVIERNAGGKRAAQGGVEICRQGRSLCDADRLSETVVNPRSGRPGTRRPAHRDFAALTRCQLYWLRHGSRSRSVVSRGDSERKTSGPPTRQRVPMQLEMKWRRKSCQSLSSSLEGRLYPGSMGTTRVQMVPDAVVAPAHENPAAERPNTH